MSTEKGHVYLFNGDSRDAVITFNLPCSVASPTLKRNAYIPTTIVLPKNNTIDITLRLDVTREKALELCASSYEVQKLGHLISIIDGDAQEAILNKVLVDPAVLQQLNQGPTHSHASKPNAVQHLNMETLPPDVIGHGVPQAVTGDENPVTGAGEAQAAIPPGETPATYLQRLGEQAADQIPSIAWARTKLVDKAKTLGIEVTSTMSKAAILRKIRAWKPETQPLI